MKQEKSCGVIAYHIAADAVQVLLIRHRYGGHWAFPKGHIEPGESERETALRELQEETGMQAVLQDGYREITTYSPARGVSKDVVMFVGRLTGGVLRAQPEEVHSVELLPAAEALERLSYAADKRLLEKALPLMQ